MTGPAAPLISVVLPVGNVAEYLPACLDSVLGPGPAGQAGLEVIAVDDASNDAVAASSTAGPARTRACG
jgi:CDP-glycerol glycerophosphotransferase